MVVLSSSLFASNCCLAASNIGSDGSTAVKRQPGSSLAIATISCAVPPAPTTSIFAELVLPRLAASIHAHKSWQASYPASAIRLCRPYSLAREVSNFPAELRGDDFKAVLHVLKSSYARHGNNQNSLILCGAFLQGMHGAYETWSLGDEPDFSESPSCRKTMTTTRRSTR